jgi:hypothetical protein
MPTDRNELVWSAAPGPANPGMWKICQAFRVRYRSFLPHFTPLPRQMVPTNLAGLFLRPDILYIESKKRKRPLARSFSVLSQPFLAWKGETVDFNLPSHNLRLPTGRFSSPSSRRNGLPPTVRQLTDFLSNRVAGYPRKDITIQVQQNKGLPDTTLGGGDTPQCPRSSQAPLPPEPPSPARNLPYRSGRICRPTAWRGTREKTLLSRCNKTKAWQKQPRGEGTP